MGSGPFLIAGAAIAALVAAARRKGQVAPPPPPQRPVIDPTLVNVRPVGATSALATTTQRDLTNKKITAAVVGAALSLATTVMSAAGVNTLQLLGTIMSSIAASAELAAFAIVAVVVAIFVVISSIFGTLKNEQLRLKTARAASGGTFYTLNTWEWKTARTWLDQMKVPYVIQSSVKDQRLETTFYDDQGVSWTMQHDRVAIVPTGVITPDDWLQIQLLIRCAALNYYTRISKYLYFNAVNLRVPGAPFGTEAPAPFIDQNGAEFGPDPKASVTTGFESTGVQMFWTEMPLIGDTTPTDQTGVLPDGTIYPSRYGSYSQIVSQFSQSQPMTWKHIVLNNHFAAILSALAMYKVDPRQVDDWQKYAAHMYYGIALRNAYDHCWVDGASIKFDPNYWGWFVELKAQPFKMGQAGAITIIDSTGREVASSF